MIHVQSIHSIEFGLSILLHLYINWRAAKYRMSPRDVNSPDGRMASTWLEILAIKIILHLLLVNDGFPYCKWIMNLKKVFC